MSRDRSAQSGVEKASHPFLNVRRMRVFTDDRAVVRYPDRHDTTCRVGKGADCSPDGREVAGIPLELHAIALALPDNFLELTEVHQRTASVKVGTKFKKDRRESLARP